MLAFKLSSHKVQSVWQQLQSTYLSQGSMYLLCICPSPHDYIRYRFHKQLQQPKQRKSYLTCLRHCKTVQIPVKEKHESKLTTKFPVSFQNTVQSSFHFLHSSGRFHWLTAIHAQLKHFHNCSSNQGCYLMHLRNQDQRSQTGGVHMSPYSRSVVNQQSQHQVPLCLQCHDGSYFSLSLSTPVPILPGKQQCFRLQSQGHQSVQTSVKLHCSCTLLNLRCSTTHVLSHKCGN